MALTLAAILGGCPGARCGTEAAPAATIVRLALPQEAEERQPVRIPTEPENTVEIEFPLPVEDWAGRGFTPDPEKFAGDFVIGANRGKNRIYVTPVAVGAHRVLHVVLEGPGGIFRSVPIELVAAPTGLAWRKVVFESAPLPAETLPAVTLNPWRPRAALREASAQSELGLIRTLRLMLNTTAAGAAAIVAANSSLALATLAGRPRSFGDFTLTNRFAVRDAETGTLAICVSVANTTAKRLLFQPDSWVVRVGDWVYPVPTVDFSDELEPATSAPAFLVLAKGPDGSSTRLRPDNDFQVSVVLQNSVNPRPVMRTALEGFGPP